MWLLFEGRQRLWTLQSNQKFQHSLLSVIIAHWALISTNMGDEEGLVKEPKERILPTTVVVKDLHSMKSSF